LIVENLRFLYETETHDVATTPIFMGMKLKADGKLFNGGGSGYVLNRVAYSSWSGPFHVSKQQSII
jgi:hypothetical protein